MDSFVEALTKILVGIGAVFVFILTGTLMGAIASWVVGLVFSDTILGILNQFGIKGITMWQFGTFMGFVGGFLKTKTSVEMKK